MANGQRTKTVRGSGSKAATLGGSTSWQPSANTEKGASKSLRKFMSTTATMSKGFRKIWKSAELAELQSKAGIVAGALADFTTAKGTVVRQEMTYTAPSGRVCKAIKLILLVEDMNLVAEKTEDGLDFNLVAVEDE